MTEAFEWTPRDFEFADARRILNRSCPEHRAQALTESSVQLAAEGDPRPQFRDLIIRAATIIDTQTEGTP